MWWWKSGTSNAVYTICGFWSSFMSKQMLKEADLTVAKKNKWIVKVTAWKYKITVFDCSSTSIITVRGQQGPVICRFTVIKWIKSMIKNTRLIPHNTVLQHESLIKCLQLLFDQVGQLRTSSYLQRWSGTSSCKVNRYAGEQRGVTTFLMIRFNTKQSGSTLPSNVPPIFLHNHAAYTGEK